MSGLTATYISATSFSVATDLTGDFAVGVRVRADCGVDGEKYGTVGTVSYSSPNTTVGVTLDSGSLTSNLVTVWHGNDVPNSLCNHASLHMIDGRDEITPADIGAMPAERRINTAAPLYGGGNLWSDLTIGVDPADTDGTGVVELATNTEAVAGTDAARVAPVSALRQAYSSWQRDEAGLFPGIIPPALRVYSRDKALPGIVSFTRASNGTYHSAAGVTKSATTNAPRFAHGPNGALRGLIIEAAATNQVKYSNNFDYTHKLALTSVSGTFTVGETVTGGTGSGTVVSYTPGATAYILIKNGTGTFSGTVTGGTSGATGTYSSVTALHVLAGLTSTPGAATGPDGLTSASKLGESSTSVGAHSWVSAESAITANAVCVGYVKIKSAERTKVKVQLSSGNYASGVSAFFDLNTLEVSSLGTFGTAGAVANAASVIEVEEGFYLCRISGIVSTTATTARLGVTLMSGSNTSYAGTVGYGVYMAQVQIESGSIPTSYIETSDSTVTRAADVCSVALSGIDFNTKEGSILVKARTPLGKPTSAEVLLQIDDGSTSNRIYVNRGVTGILSFVVDVAGSTVVNLGATAVPDDTDFVCIISWKENAFGFSLTGVADLTDTAGAVPSGLTHLRVGSPVTAANMWLGPIDQLVYFPRALTAAQRQSLVL